jgi:hypothetical protein
MADNYSLTVTVNEHVHTLGNTKLTGTSVGDELSFHIRLEPHEDIKCSGVWLEIGYHEGGNGSLHDERLVQKMFYTGELRRFNVIDQDFLYDIPSEGPISYAGTYVKFNWYIRIRIDIPLWFDPREEREFRVLPRIMESEDDMDGYDDEESDYEQQG